jgi:hypothetical protein
MKQHCRRCHGLSILFTRCTSQQRFPFSRRLTAVLLLLLHVRQRCMFHMIDKYCSAALNVPEFLDLKHVWWSSCPYFKLQERKTCSSEQQYITSHSSHPGWSGIESKVGARVREESVSIIHGHSVTSHRISYYSSLRRSAYWPAICLFELSV